MKPTTAGNQDGQRKNKYRIGEESKTDQIIRQYNLKPDMKDLGFELTKLK